MSLNDESTINDDNDYNNFKLKQIKSAVIIQRLWRRYIDLQVAKYYKDLILFHNCGDPQLIMKYINPIEAKLIDAASGIHIKFRLAGVSEPTKKQKTKFNFIKFNSIQKKISINFHQQFIIKYLHIDQFKI
jgi:hypothetical protein